MRDGNSGLSQRTHGVTVSSGSHLEFKSNHDRQRSRPHRPTSAARPALNPDALEVAPGTAHEKLEGWIPQLASDEELRHALEKAFDYRGDITITRKDGSQNRRLPLRPPHRRNAEGFLVRLYPKNSNEKISIPYAEIAALAFTGRDTAAGKSLGSLDEKIRREKSRRRKRPEPLLRTSRLDTSFRSVILSGVEVLALR